MTETEPERHRIYGPHTSWCPNYNNGPPHGKYKVYWKPLHKQGKCHRKYLEYPTRQKALKAISNIGDPKIFKVRKMPKQQPLTETQQSLLTTINRRGYDSCYNILRYSKYSIPWHNMKNFMGGTINFLPLVDRGLIALKIGINPRRGGTRTCTIAALPWVMKYHERFKTWPAPELVKEMRGTNAEDKSCSNTR